MLVLIQQPARAFAFFPATRLDSRNSMFNLPCHFGLVGNPSLFAGGTMCINQFFLTYSKGNMKAGS